MPHYVNIKLSGNCFWDRYMQCLKWGGVPFYFIQEGP